MKIILRKETNSFIEDAAPDIYRLETYIPGLNIVFAVYFIKDKDSGVIIEPGPAAIAPDIQSAVEELEIRHILYIIPTHIHLDHGGGLGRLMQIYPAAKTVLSAQAAKHAVNPARLIASTRLSFGPNFEKLYGSFTAVPDSRIQIVRDGEKLRFGERELQFIHTPGHASHHMAIMDSLSRGLFCGEALGLMNKNGIPLSAVAPPGFDEEIYLKDMEKLRALKPELLFYSHGRAGREPDKLITAAIENTRDIGAVVLGFMKQKLDDEAVILKTGEYIRKRFGDYLDPYEMETNVKAFIYYYRKKGMVK